MHVATKGELLPGQEQEYVGGTGRPPESHTWGTHKSDFTRDPLSIKDLSNTFKPHPCSPINISPTTARMGGNITNINNKILRFGQNNENEYGESLSIFEINELTPTSYIEKQCGSLSIEKTKGPHCLNVSPDKKKIVLDFYEIRFSFFAWYRRFRAIIQNRFLNKNKK